MRYLKCVMWFSSRAMRRLLMASKCSFSSMVTVPIPSGLTRQKYQTNDTDSCLLFLPLSFLKVSSLRMTSRRWHDIHSKMTTSIKMTSQPKGQSLINKHITLVKVECPSLTIYTEFAQHWFISKPGDIPPVLLLACSIYVAQALISVKTTCEWTLMLLFLLSAFTWLI